MLPVENKSGLTELDKSVLEIFKLPFDHLSDWIFQEILNTIEFVASFVEVIVSFSWWCMFWIWKGCWTAKINQPQVMHRLWLFKFRILKWVKSGVDINQPRDLLQSILYNAISFYNNSISNNTMVSRIFKAQIFSFSIDPR